MNEVWSAIRVTLQISLFATVIVTFFGGAIAYLLARFRFPGRRLIEALITLPLVLPPTVVGFYLLILFSKKGILGQPIYAATGWSLILTWQGAVLAATIMALPLMIKTTRAALESVNQGFLVAAYSLGLNEFQALWAIWLPLAWKGISTGIILSFARSLGEFGATLIIAGNIAGETQTLSLAIYDAVQIGNQDLAIAMVMILTAIATVTILAVNFLGGQNDWN
jgi:molybdate transport system permease protein